VIGIAAFGLFILATLRARWIDGRNGELGAAILGAFAAIAAFPQYFLYRPDLPHVANFMPGYVVMAAVFIHQARIRPPSLKVGTAAFFGLHLALYVWIGLNSQITGSIGLAKHRTETFQARNGVDERVMPGEKQVLEAARDVIEQNSQVGDAIVCLPYCPGFAFMTARRMLLHNFYVDDGILASEPDWIASAIAQTAAARPPVVLISDWAVNGTERSRFTVWAAAYVDAVKGMARDTHPLPGGFTAYVLAR
jgi:hypothetical protein